MPKVQDNGNAVFLASRSRSTKNDFQYSPGQEDLVDCHTKLFDEHGTNHI